VSDPDPEQLDRYARHVVADGVGPEGQAALRDAAVLVVGAGGLGAPIVQYLAAAGVGTIGIADDDVVELSNLQRQVIHGTDDVGRPKVDSAEEFVAGLDPDVTVHGRQTEVGPENVETLVEAYDFVVDGTDNVRTRFLINDACTLGGVPFSHGAISRFEGHVTTFLPGDGPCYRCLFPRAPPAGTVPDCAATGVLGVLPGTVGTLQATETVKWIVGAGESLDGRMVVYDATSLAFDEVRIRPAPDCPACGDDPAIDSVDDVDYDGACAVGAD